MEKELTINGKLYRLVEKPALEVGKWYYNIWAKIYILILNNGTHYEIDSSNRCYISGYKTSVLEVKDYETADMCKVEKLIISEAEKRGFEEGVEYVSPDGIFNRTIKGCIVFDNDHNCLKDGDGNVIFDGETGKWAEITEEKKHLYYVRRENNAIFENPWGNVHIGGGSKVTKTMSLDECKQWIKDNTNRLR